MKTPNLRTLIKVFFACLLIGVMSACGGGGGSSDTGNGGGGGDNQPPEAPGGEFDLIVGTLIGSTTVQGDIAEFDLQLPSQPTADVTFRIGSSDTAEAIVESVEMTFTPDNWDQPQTVVVRGTNSAVVNDMQDYVIVLGTIESSDTDYGGQNIRDVPMNGISLNVVEITGSDVLVSGVETLLQVVAQYNGSDDLTYSLLNAPVGMIIDEVTGVISWTPQTDGIVATVTAFVSDGTRDAQLTADLAVANETSLSLSASPTRVEVDAAASDLDGLSLSSEQVDLATTTIAQLDALFKLPEDIEPVGLPFRINVASVDGEITLRLPALSLLDGFDEEDIELYMYSPDVIHAEGPLWSPTLVDPQYEGELEAPVVLTSLIQADGIYQIVLDRLEDEAESLEKFEGAITGDGVNVVGRADIDDITCEFVRRRNSLRSRRVQACTHANSTDFVMAIRDFRRINIQPAVSIEELAGWLYDAQDSFRTLGLSFDDKIRIKVHTLKPGLLGYVSGRENFRFLHLTSRSGNKTSFQGTAVHEYFHQAQARTKVLGKTNILAAAQTDRRLWIIEGLARWFEDDLFDSLDTYQRKERPPLRRILEAGFAAEEGKFIKRPYARFGLWKLIDEHCGGFTGTLKLADILNADLSGDSFASKHLDALLAGADCNFTTALGVDNQSSMSALLANYQYATLVANDISLIDSNENRNEYNFANSPRKIESDWWSPLLSPEFVGERGSLFGPYQLPPTGAMHFTLAGSDSPVPEMKEAYLLVDAPQGTPVAVSVTSSSPDFRGDALTPLHGQPHIGFNSADVDGFNYDFNDRIPELSVSVINPSTTSRVPIRIGFGLQFRDGTYSWSSSTLCQEGDASGPYNRTWLTGLTIDGDDLRGTIYFHACPGGGRAAYSLSGVLDSDSDVFVVSGQLTSSRGPLAETVPDSAIFTLSNGAAPSPNFAR